MKHRIVLALDRLELGGAERQAILLARGLISRGHEVTLIGTAPGAAMDLAIESRIPVIVNPYPRPSAQFAALSAAIALIRQVRRLRPTVIMGYTSLPNLVFALIWRLTGARGFIWNQRDLGMGLGRLPRLERLLLKSPSAFISNSEAGKAFLASLGVPKSAITVIRNGIDIGAAKADRSTWRSRLGVDEGAHLIVKVANLTPAKDHATVFRSLASATPVNAVLALAGRDDGNGASLRQLAQDLGIEDRVRFLGKVDDIRGLLEAADLLVHSSPSESSSNAIIEAALCGIPVICSDIPANREALPNLSPHQYFSPGEPVDLGLRMARFFDDPTSFEASTKLAQEFSLKCYSSDGMVERSTATIIQVLDA